AMPAVPVDAASPASLPPLAAVPPELTDSGDVHRLAMVSVDVLGLLLLRVCRVPHPLVPAVRGDHAASVLPDGFEELAGGRRLAPGIDRWRALTLRPERRPTPRHEIPPQPVRVLVQYPHPRPRRDVVPVDGFRIHSSDNWGNNADALQVFPRYTMLNKAAAHDASGSRSFSVSVDPASYSPAPPALRVHHPVKLLDAGDDHRQRGHRVDLRIVERGQGVGASWPTVVNVGDSGRPAEWVILLNIDEDITNVRLLFLQPRLCFRDASVS